MAYNTILIRRRLQSSGATGVPTLSNGELAYNEKTNELYYGGEFGTLTIAGSGAYLKLDTDQTITGSKTFTSLTNLSSTTFSAGSIIDAGGNQITNVAGPSLSSHAATKKYVDDEIASLGSTGNSAVEALSTEVYNNFVEKIESEAVTLNGGLTVSSGLSTDSLTTTGDATIGQNLTVTGNLSVLGTQTVVNTETINISGTSTQIDVINNGTGTGITVNQTGNEDVAEFKDDGATALIIKGDSVTPGYVGIGTATPNEKLTVNGNLSANGTIYALSGFEVGSSGATTLYVTNGKVGINTETPNEEFTVVGDISATGNVYGVNGDFTGTMDIDGATTLGSTLYVTNAATFASSVSAQGALTVDGSADLNSTLSVDGATTLGSTLDVTGASTFASSVSAQGALVIDGTSTLNGAVTVDDTLYVSNAVTFASTLSTQGAVDFDSTFNVDGASTFGDLVTITASTTTTGSISGSSGISYIVDFVIDGGVF